MGLQAMDVAPFVVVIPARFASTRFPGKPLHPLAGRPMLQWVYESAVRSGARTVVVATDDERIATVARNFGADVMMTDGQHASGTDRVAQVARQRKLEPQDIVVNWQGDEPLMPVAAVRQAAQLLQQYPTADIATLATPLPDATALDDANVVKVVSDQQQRALYFSRAAIPHARVVTAAEAGPASAARMMLARRHLGLYAYRVQALQRMAAMPPSKLEQLEKLEQLRALEAGMDIRVADACELPGPDVNTPEDVLRVAQALSSRSTGAPV